MAVRWKSSHAGSQLAAAMTGGLLVACCVLSRLPAGPVALSSSSLVYPATRAEARFAHPDAQDLVGYEAEASRKAADGFHPFTPHAFSPAPQLAQQSIGPQAGVFGAKQGQLQQLMAHPKARLSSYLLHKPLHRRFSTEPAGGRHIPAHPKETLSHHLLTSPRHHKFSTQPAGGNHLPAAHNPESLTHHLLTKPLLHKFPGRGSQEPHSLKARPAAAAAAAAVAGPPPPLNAHGRWVLKGTQETHRPWWKGRGQEGRDVASAARWGLMHPAGEEKQSSMLQRITQHERPADKAYWSKLGYKSSLKEPRPKCRLFHDC